MIQALGYDLHEMFRHGRGTNCCGGEILEAHSPETALSVAARRQEEAARTGAEMIVTACAGCAENLRGAGGLPVRDVVELLADGCL